MLTSRNFPGGPVIKNPPCNAGDTGLILGWETKISHAEEQLSLNAARHNYWALITTRESVRRKEKTSHDVTKT